MSTVTGTLRNGKVELHGPPPPTWTDGKEVVVSEPTAAEIDITGDSPEAIAAWLKWFEELHASIQDSKFPDELEKLLREDKAQELALWDERSKKIEGLIP